MSASGPTFKPGLMSNVNPANTDRSTVVCTDRERAVWYQLYVYIYPSSTLRVTVSISFFALYPCRALNMLIVLSDLFWRVGSDSTCDLNLCLLFFLKVSERITAETRVIGRSPRSQSQSPSGSRPKHASSAARPDLRLLDPGRPEAHAGQ